MSKKIAAKSKSKAPVVVLKKEKPMISQKNKFFVVGIGASAGGLEAFKQFFDQLSPNTGMAFVVVQHLDPTHKSILASLIATHTQMPVVDIKNGVLLKPNCVYIIPANKDLSIAQGVLHIAKVSEQRAKRKPIDAFFHSLAADQQERAIGVILSGTGTDGTLGLIEIKALGGKTIVQDPSSAQFSGMPDSAINAKVADYILPPGEMPQQLLRCKSNTKLIGNHRLLEDELVLNESQLNKILKIIKAQTGYDFFNYKPNTLVRRIIKRMAFLKINSVADYTNLLEREPSETVNIYKDFLIGVTSFFRDKDVFAYFAKKVFPYLADKKQDQLDFRVWVCGCSTGEEAYSYAILFKELLEKKKLLNKVVIFASDIDKVAIDTARKAIFPLSINHQITPERLTRFFTKGETGYQLKKEIRDMVVFAHHNVINDPPFSKLDFISCRNLLIYLNNEVQKKILQNFHYSLNDEGILLLGPSESIGEPGKLFSVYEEKYKVFKKLNGTKRNNGLVYELPFAAQKGKLYDSKPVITKMNKINISDLTEKILLDQYAPPSVIIDNNNVALYFSGNTGLFLEPPVGLATLDILEMARNGLKMPLAEAINTVRKTSTALKTKGLELLVGGDFKMIKLHIKPLLSKEYNPGTLLISFESDEKRKKKVNKNQASISDKDKFKAQKLEKELKTTREHLQIAIKELETSNEDFQSSNEELQSTNEELETSREELQSVNEELITVNSELTGKIEQLFQSNNDLTNLLRSIEVATLFLDKSLKIKRFTPAAVKIFNLIPTDIDRPLTQLSTNLQYLSLEADLRIALKTLIVKSVEVCATDGTWYFMRIIPYRTAENIIEGVLVTLVDISGQKKTELELKKANEYLNLIMENLPVVSYTTLLQPALKMDFVSKSCEKMTGFPPEKFTGKMEFWLGRIHPDDKENVLVGFNEIARKDSLNQVFRWKCSDGKYKKFINNIRYTPEGNGRPAYVVGVWQESLVV